jgi:RimJ/RimL family protein N-acetyltransferase
MKLKLKKLTMSNAKDLKNAINNKEVIEKLENAPYPYKLSDARKYIKKSLAKSKKKETYEFGIMVGKEFVGTIVLENPSLSKKSYEVGYFVSRKYWGKGIATKALKEIMKFGFTKLKLKRIWGGVLATNKNSIRVLEKVGFKREGHLRKATYKNRKYYDDYIYARVK